MAAFSGSADSLKPALDIASFFEAFAGNDGDSDSEAEETVSMFCKACLHPYSGEEKAGTIVLRCKNCGQTDTILEEKVGNINPQQWIGDLMKNRFLQVIKEQENLKMNLVDPNFCDDDYRRVTLALEEYTNNIQAVAECMYDVVRQVNYPRLDEQLMVSVEKEAIEIEAMRATNRLIKIHKALLENSQSTFPKESSADSSSAQNETASGRKGKGKRGSGKRGKGKRLSKEESEFETDMKEIAEMTRQHSQTLGNTVLTLINELIEKYKLPDDLMERIEERIINQYSDEKEAKPAKNQRIKRKGRKSAGQHTEIEKNNSQNVVQPRAQIIKEEQADVLKESDKTESEAKGESSRSNDNITSKSKQTTNDVNHTTLDLDDVRVRSRDKTAEEVEMEAFEALFREDSAESEDPFEEQFYAALEEKFSIQFSDKDVLKLERDNCAKDNTVEPNEEVAAPNLKKDDANKDDVAKVEKDETEVPQKRSKQSLSLHFKKTNEGFMVNFYTLSAAFINELQVIKSKALDKRKEKALAELHERIQMMKKEMEKIEDAVTQELAKAYERKMKKSAKQREKMNEKQKQLREAERLLNFYAQTGQHDKIREMNEELDRICGNPN